MYGHLLPLWLPKQAQRCWFMYFYTLETTDEETQAKGNMSGCTSPPLFISSLGSLKNGP